MLPCAFAVGGKRSQPIDDELPLVSGALVQADTQKYPCFRLLPHSLVAAQSNEAPPSNPTHSRPSSEKTKSGLTYHSYPCRLLSQRETFAGDPTIRHAVPPKAIQALRRGVVAAWGCPFPGGLGSGFYTANQRKLRAAQQAQATLLSALMRHAKDRVRGRVSSDTRVAEPAPDLGFARPPNRKTTTALSARQDRLATENWQRPGANVATPVGMSQRVDSCVAVGELWSETMQRCGR
ncbi:hypothetical protein B0T26DRAFT_331643 [Lasiosphaeria miniovina]|uniref:Uncharacterized protein n=1 Tax=Lasiosphaeria miniovina TaxID=1954250 RepID=A0AA40AM82_9PEZI|nr:uncharacterized protein B0T26DRAFT_331643 [Lasiosphaeria miniovina]KAK0718448.1 hypothetical protein B0T26DRAFT_331643 [Lasiosphaeria miniovina]